MAEQKKGQDVDVNQLLKVRREKLQDLQVIGGLNGLSFAGSKFFEDGQTIDIVVCYTLDPILPIDLMPEMNLMNRATIKGMSGSSIF